MPHALRAWNWPGRKLFEPRASGGPFPTPGLRRHCPLSRFLPWRSSLLELEPDRSPASGPGSSSLGVRIYKIDAWLLLAGRSGASVTAGWKECDTRETRNTGCQALLLWLCLSSLPFLVALLISHEHTCAYFCTYTHSHSHDIHAQTQHSHIHSRTHTRCEDKPLGLRGGWGAGSGVSGFLLGEGLWGADQ